MRKKLIKVAVALAAIALLLPIFAAYEAHVVNVKAHIEKALRVEPQNIDYGIVFPQEQPPAPGMIKKLVIKESDSLSRQKRVVDVKYRIVQKPKPIDPTDPTKGMMKFLGPFLDKQKQPIALGGDGEENDNSTTHEGIIDKSIGDLQDMWEVKLFVPCISPNLCQDHGTNACPTFPCGGPNFTTCQSVPEDPAGSGDAGDWGADLWVEVTGYSYEHIKGDTLIDLDGDVSTGVGTTQEVKNGDPLLGVGWNAVDMFDRDSSGTWSPGDDLHLERPPASLRDAVHQHTGSPTGFVDPMILDLDNNFLEGDLVGMGLIFGDLDVLSDTILNASVKLGYHDANGNGMYDLGEDIVYDANQNGIYD